MNTHRKMMWSASNATVFYLRQTAQFLVSYFNNNGSVHSQVGSGIKYKLVIFGKKL